MSLFTPHSSKCIKPLSLAVSSLLLAACSSAPTVSTTHQSVSKTVGANAANKAGNARSAQENAALLDMDSLDELEGLLEATDMTMVENNALLVQRYGNLWDRLRVNFRMNANVYDPRIEAQKSWFITRQDYLNRLTARASRYLYYTVREAERRNIPTELALLPVIESSYDPNANSNASAAGLWQFIPSTGRIYGLNQTSTFDGRRDVIESTRAAYDFLTALYNQFGSWELALAAYNAGPGRIQSAINYNEARGLPTDYWSLKLPTETMNYVPRFLAVAQIVKNPSSYNVNLPAIANRQHFRSVPANVGVSLSEVSSLTGVGYDELRALNPALIAGAVDTSGPSRVLIPNDINESIDRQISQLRGNGYMSQQGYLANNSYVTPTTNRPATTTYTPPKNNGESLSATQQAFGKKEPAALPSSSSELAAMANSMVKNQTTTYIAPIIPAAPTATTTNTVIKEPPITVAEQRQVTAEMQSTNTLPTTSAIVTPNNTIVQEPPLTEQERSLIAKQIEQTAPQVEQAINPKDGNIKLDAIQTQQSVLEAKGESKKLTYEEPSASLPKTVATKPANTIAKDPATSTEKMATVKRRPVGTRSTYQVKSGDTLANIGSRMGVSWRDIAEWNQMDANAPLLAGATLYLYDAKPTEPKPLGQVINLPVKAEKIKYAQTGKSVAYTVRAGDSLGSIANSFDLSVADLAKANNMKPTASLLINQKIIIPQSTTSVPTKPLAIKDKDTGTKSEREKKDSKSVKSSRDTQSYQVKSGDSLTNLSNKYGIAKSELAALNNLKGNESLLIGQTIKLPKTTTTYKVKSGDGLISLAARYGISAKELAAMNGLSPSASLKMGQTITVPNQ